MRQNLERRPNAVAAGRIVGRSSRPVGEAGFTKKAGRSRHPRPASRLNPRVNTAKSHRSEAKWNDRNDSQYPAGGRIASIGVGYAHMPVNRLLDCRRQAGLLPDSRELDRDRLFLLLAGDVLRDGRQCRGH